MEGTSSPGQLALSKPPSLRTEYNCTNLRRTPFHSSVNIVMLGDIQKIRKNLREIITAEDSPAWIFSANENFFFK